MLQYRGSHRGQVPCVCSPAGGDMEERIAQTCQEFGVPQWVKSILEVSAKMKDDKLRRRKAYRMVRRQLWAAGIGLDRVSFPTYVYPGNLKALIRSLFPENICNYPDPDHDKVVKVTMEDLFLVSDEKP
ncbi:uncharacterized protein LOC143809250 isoform X1 [Ranitomeya variabilis]|uniref:uncharacterized protein LOC143809250 isoform X1 n=1 Tax=Ranitomeya variabilis TaxID=490064 RepID=UPI004056C965